MYIARILYPVEVLGPGKRIGIWLCGCPHHCDGCSNPELWEFRVGCDISVDEVMRLIGGIASENPVDGFTITGGEPFYQSEDLSELITAISPISDDILVYSGYTIDELNGVNVLSKIAVLIDGKYVANLNTDCLLRGSENQKIHVLNSGFDERYRKYLSTSTNKIQNFTSGNSVISVGIHKQGCGREIQHRVNQKGLEAESNVRK